MSARAFRRKMQKLDKQEDLKDRLKKAYEEQKEMEKVILDAVRDAEKYTKHHITGELYTATAVILRKPPYRWPAAKVMRLLEAIGGGNKRPERQDHQRCRPGNRGRAMGNQGDVGRGSQIH